MADSLTLLLRLVGPLQSWGSVDYTERRSGTKPTRSGVVGLMAGALGRRKGEDVSDLMALDMAVRVDAPGALEYDAVTARGVLAADLALIHEHSRTERYHLADAAFLVGTSGNAALLREVDTALRMPRYMPYLGRREYPPGYPVWLNDGLQTEDLTNALSHYPPLVEKPQRPMYVTSL